MLITEKLVTSLKRLLWLGLLLNICITGCEPKYEDPDPNVEILAAFPCKGSDEKDRPLEAQPIFPSDARQIHICAYQQKGGPGTLTIDWHSSKKFLEFTYIRTDNGWFFPVLEAGGKEFPVGIFEVKIRAGRSVQAVTRFEVVPAEK